MSSTIPISEKKRKSSKSSSKSKKSSSKHDDLLGEPVKASNKSKKVRSSSKKAKDQVLPDETTSQLSDDITTEEDNKIEDIANDATDKVNDTAEQANNQVEDATEQANGEINEAAELDNDQVDEVVDGVEQEVNDSDDDEEADSDALTTMNAIMEYNRKLVQRIHELEAQSGGLNKEDVQGTVKDTLDEVPAKYNKKEESSGKHHSFELPIGDMMKGYGSLSTSALPDVNETPKKSEDEDSTVKGNDGKIRIGDGEKDDIVVKIEATKTGITFSIHIPRN